MVAQGRGLPNPPSGDVLIEARGQLQGPEPSDGLCCHTQSGCWSSVSADPRCPMLVSLLNTVYQRPGP